MDGITAPAHRATGHSGSPSFDPAPLLVGREREQVFLREEFATARDGRGRLVLLCYSDRSKNGLVAMVEGIETLEAMLLDPEKGLAVLHGQAREVQRNHLRTARIVIAPTGGCRHRRRAASA